MVHSDIFRIFVANIKYKKQREYDDKKNGYNMAGKHFKGYARSIATDC